VSDDTYEGWHNRETLAVNLWLMNDQGLYDKIYECMSVEQLEALVRRESIDQVPAPSGLLVDLVEGALARVDYDEIYEQVKEARIERRRHYEDAELRSP